MSELRKGMGICLHAEQEAMFFKHTNHHNPQVSARHPHGHANPGFPFLTKNGGHGT